MKKHFQIIFVFLVTIFSLNFFEARFLPEEFTRMSQFFIIFIAVAVSVPFAFPKWEGFVFPLQLITAAILLSVVFANMFWSQGITEGMKATVPYMLWIFVFYLLKIKFPLKTLENIILIFTGLYIMLYLFQFANSETPYFGWSSSFSNDRGIIRIIFPGGGIFFLGSFMALNKLTLKNSNKFFWAPFALAGLIVPVMQVTRQLIAATLFIYILHLTRGLSMIKKGAIILTFIAAVVFVSTSNLSVVKGLKGVQEETSSQGVKYIRLVAANYFLTEFQPNTISRIVGNGVPYGDKSAYGKFYTKIKETKDYYLSDVGMVAVYTMFGVLAIVALVMIWIKSFTIPLPKEYLYLKYYLWLLLITGFTSNSVYHYNYLIATVFVIYMYQRLYLRSKNSHSIAELLKKHFSEQKIPLIQQPG